MREKSDKDKEEERKIPENFFEHVIDMISANQ